MGALSEQTKVTRSLQLGLLPRHPPAQLKVLSWLANQREYTWWTGGYGLDGQPLYMKQETWALMMEMGRKTLERALKELRDRWKYVYSSDGGRYGHVRVEHVLSSQFVQQAVDWYDYIWMKDKLHDHTDNGDDPLFYPGLTALYRRAAIEGNLVALHHNGKTLHKTWRDLVQEYYPERLDGTAL